MLDDEQRRLGEFGPAQSLVAVRRPQDRPRILAQVRGQQLAARVESAAEGRQMIVELAAHAGELGALAGKGEDHRRLLVVGATGRPAAGERR